MIAPDEAAESNGEMRLRDRIDVDAIPYAAGAILLGLVTIAVQDFALQWQPVPAGLPGRAPLAIISGVALIVGGLAVLWKGAGRVRMPLPAFYGLWVLALHVPNFIASPTLPSLLGVAEILSIAAGGWVLAIGAREKLNGKILRILYGLCPLVFGVSHFVYADFTAAMVPGWVPAQLFWAYFTGAAHFAAGVAILSGVLARLAASLLALMCGLFALLLHAPRVLAAPQDRGEWTMLAIALSIAGAAWLIRLLFPRQASAQTADRGLAFAGERI